MSTTRVAFAVIVAILLGTTLSGAADAGNCTTTCYGNTCYTHCY